MCELLGMSFYKPINPNLLFKTFRNRGERNPHGWGIAYYPDRSAQIIKEAININSSSLFEFIMDYKEIKSNIFIAHVRDADSGSIIHENTHPFQRELFGKDYTFIHNGNLKNYNELSINRFIPIGVTDSEYVFCHIMGLIEERSIKEWNRNNFLWLKQVLMNINEYGRFNCIFSDSEYLFCYFDKNGSDGLYYIEEKNIAKSNHLTNETYQRGFIITTKPLNNGNWEKFKKGELIIFRKGSMIFSNQIL